MGELIDITERLADRSRPRRDTVTFFFDLVSPHSYLAAERVERLFGRVEWVPVAPIAGAVTVKPLEAERDALALRLPLVWPDPLPAAVPRATRVAAFAAQSGRAGAFALAACRLAFCGGYDLEDDGILTDAATAAGLSSAEALAAADDPAYDEQPQATAAGLAQRGVGEAPVIRVHRHWRSGGRAVAEAAAILHAANTGSRASGRG